MKKFKIKKIIWILMPLIVIGGVAFFVFGNKKSKIEYTLAKVAKQNISQTVSETGTVKSDSEIELGFFVSGKLEKKNFKVGDKIKVNDVLAELDKSRLQISKNEAAAGLNSALQSLDKLLAGATEQEKRISRTNLNQAESSLGSAQNELAKVKAVVVENISQAQKNLDKLENSEDTALRRAVILAETNLRNTKTTQQKGVDDSRSAALVASEDKIVGSITALDVLDGVLNDEVADEFIGAKQPGSYDAAKNLLREARQLVSPVQSDLTLAKSSLANEQVKKTLQSSLDLQNKTFSALQSAFYALESSITSSNFSQSALDALKAKISTQQSSVAAGISAMQSAKNSFESALVSYNTTVSSAEESLAQARAALNDAIISARDALKTARISGDQQIASAESRVRSAEEAKKMGQAELERVLAPANEHDILLAKSKIAQAEAAVKSIEKQLDDCVLRSPIAGTLTKFNFEVGEQVSQGAMVSAILGENNFKIEVLISEADIAKVNRDDAAEITLDSFGDEKKFSGKVVFIEPAETEIQDVVYYKVDVLFDEVVEGIKSGMTANVIIVTDHKEGVLIVPSRAIVDKNGSGKFVKVLGGDGSPVEKKIELGLRGDDGVVEVLSGLMEGENVITYTKEEK